MRNPPLPRSCSSCSSIEITQALVEMARIVSHVVAILGMLLVVALVATQVALAQPGKFSGPGRQAAPHAESSAWSPDRVQPTRTIPSGCNFRRVTSEEDFYDNAFGRRPAVFEAGAQADWFSAATRSVSDLRDRMSEVVYALVA